MKKPVVLVHGPCITTALLEVLSNLPGASDKFEVAGFVFGRTPSEDSLVARAELVITQHRVLAYPLPLPEVTRLLPAGVPMLRFPTLIMPALWPLSCLDPRDARDPARPYGRYQKARSDRIALQVMRKYKDPAARKAAYVATDVHSVINLARLEEIQAEQMMQSEQGCEIQVVAHVLSSFRRQRLFHTHHHPTRALLFYLVAQVMAHPLFAPFRTGSFESMLRAAARILAEHHLTDAEEMPIHPQVARHFGLEWWSPDMTYRLDGRDLTFDGWLDAYLAESLD